jgi:hypothetical protein
MASNKPGGGIGSKSMARTTSYFTGQQAMKKYPAGVAQLGLAQGNHTSDPSRTTNYRGEPTKLGPMTGPTNVKLGNQTALEAGQGPGAGRTVMRSGTNNQYGKPEGTVRPPIPGTGAKGPSII